MHRLFGNGLLVRGANSSVMYAAHNLLSFSVDNFEAASLPTTSPEERKRLLSFVVCGGGPTGVETAAEIFDLCQEDIFNYVSIFTRDTTSLTQ